MGTALQPPGRKPETGPSAHLVTPEVDKPLRPPPEVQAALDLQRGHGNRATGKLVGRQPPAAVPGLLRGLPAPRLDPEEDRLQPSVVAEFFHVEPILAKEFKTPKAYADLVRTTFGSYRAYYEFAKESDAEVDTVIGTSKGKPVTLRSILDKQPTTQAQTIFYRWVRWEYVKHGASPVQIWKQGGMSATMRDKIKAAKAELLSGSGIELKVQGFNPRPKKAPKGGYRFGTLSEHAMGDAVDIDPDHNLFPSNATWNHILRETGMGHLKDKLTWDRWNLDPEGMYDDVAKVSEKWKQKAVGYFEAQQRSRRMAGSLAPELRQPTAEGPADPARRTLTLPPTPVLGLHAPEQRKAKKVSHAHSRTEREEIAIAALAHVPEMRDADKVASVETGLMTLPREVVLALRAHGLIWGATFSHPGKDLQHFELPTKKPLSRWPMEEGESP